MTKPAHIFVQAQATKGLRRDTYQGRDYLVVPVIAIVEGVLQGMNSSVPEFAAAQEFGKYPAGWNGRPVVMNHPVDDDGDAISANSPETLREWAFGQMFNTQLQGRKLRTEAWIDLKAAEDAGGDFQDTVERLQANELVEVSVGIFVTPEPRDGAYNGKKYKAVWKDVVPDHLAFLSKGTQGACSAQDGCGAPRVNQMRYVQMTHPRNSASITPSSPQNNQDNRDHDCDCDHAPPLQFLMAHYGPPTSDTLKAFKIADTLLDMDVFKALSRALRAKYGRNAFLLGFTSKTAVYGLLDEETFSIKTMQSDIKVDSNANAEFVGTPQEVTLITQIVNPKGVKANLNGVSDMTQSNDNPNTAQPPVNPPAANPPAAVSPPAAEPPANHAATPPKPADDPKPPASGPSDPPEPPTTAEAYIAAAPEGMREVLSESLRVHNAHKAALITALKATNRCDFSDASLQAMSLQDLEKLSKIAQVPTYEGQGAPRDGQGVVANAVRQSWNEALAPPPPRLFGDGGVLTGKAPPTGAATYTRRN